MKKILSKYSDISNFWIDRNERSFLSFVVVAFMLAMFATPYPQLGMWVGFIFDIRCYCYDSIQTIGTFIASNQDKKWWVNDFIGGIFLGTVGYSWFVFEGDVSHGRLMAKGFEKALQIFTFYR